MDWRESALCKGVPGPFFSNYEGGFAVADVKRAKAICAQCPVISECRTWALETEGRLHGVWGGMSQSERVKIRRMRKAA